MREILFRGKRVDNSEWVYGSPIFQDGYVLIRFWDSEEFEFQEYLVAPETVGQYTGLTDKDGKYIFEGDIISIPFEKDRGPWEEKCVYYESGEIYYDAERYGWYVKFFDDDRVSIWKYDALDVVIIGNIHDNPELLEVNNE